MTDEKTLRLMLRELLDWEGAHVGFEAAVAGIPPKLRGARPAGAPRCPGRVPRAPAAGASRHPRFLRRCEVRGRKWPDYWPRAVAPPSGAAWDESIAAFVRDRRALQKLAANPSIELTAAIPHGSGQTYLRELVLVADHTAYHVGQLVLVRQLLGAWKPARMMLVVFLRLAGCVTSAAFLAIVLPVEWMASTHQWLGLGEFPRSPVVDYLARSVAALYGFHGVLLLIISGDPIRYRSIVSYPHRLNQRHSRPDRSRYQHPRGPAGHVDDPRRASPS